MDNIPSIWINSMEWGFKAKERGINLEQARKEFIELLQKQNNGS